MERDLWGSQPAKEHAGVAEELGLPFNVILIHLD